MTAPANPTPEEGKTPLTDNDRVFVCVLSIYKALQIFIAGGVFTLVMCVREQVGKSPWYAWAIVALLIFKAWLIQRWIDGIKKGTN